MDGRINLKPEEIIERARRDFEKALAAEAENREEALSDIRFVNNVDEGQWPAEIRAQRREEKRPCLTINKLRKFVNLLVGEQRQMRPGIKVRPIGNGASVEIAEIYQDIIRHIEYISNAEVAYDTAYSHALQAGFGYWRILIDYADDVSFQKEIKIKRILNPFSVYFDQSAEEFDYSDARYAFIATFMPKDEFKELYPEASTHWFDQGVGESYANWFESDKVRVAEYFFKIPATKVLVELDTGAVYLWSPEEFEAKKAADVAIAQFREVKTYDIVWCKINGFEVLEGPVIWPGRYIPIVPVLGDEVNVEGKRIYRSVIRDAKDPQRMYNYWVTTATELVALSPKAPYLVTPEQIEGHEHMWKNANIKNYPYLLYNAAGSPHPPKREPQVQVPSGVISQLQISDNDIKDTLGLYDPFVGKESNERSGRAILLRQQQARIGAFIYFDNFLRALTYSGRILVDLIPKVYNDYRVFQILREDGSMKTIEINKRVIGKNGLPETWNDITVGTYDVYVEGGLVSPTRRAEAAETMIQFLQYAPQVAPLILDLVAKNLDIPGGQEIARRIEAFMKKTAQLEPTEELDKEKIESLLMQGVQNIEGGQ